MTAEHLRLEEDRLRKAHWRRWGPYLSERQWSTVREDYSPAGDAWNHLPHDQARSRAYRWGEDGLLGISDNHQRLCFAPALWNGRDPILKERLFGLTNTEGNHGEDVKECYYYLDSTPTHSYMKALYRYPHEEFPYRRLRDENLGRDRRAPEFELADTGIFTGDRFFDVYVEYAKAGTDDLEIRIEALNRGPEPALLEVLPTLWFRNTWSWFPGSAKPSISPAEAGRGLAAVVATHPELGTYRLVGDEPAEVLFTENETNARRLFGVPNRAPFAKDAFHDYVVLGRKGAVNPASHGTKAAFRYRRMLGPGEGWEIRLRLTNRNPGPGGFDSLKLDALPLRKSEADEFYASIEPPGLHEEERRIQRQAFAGMLWNKQYYHYVVSDWLRGDPAGPVPPPSRLEGRNHGWTHLYVDDILSVPDKWEYPWFASWDTAFHCLPLAMIDPEFAKRQLILLTREWYMHPNGQIPAFEWDFCDINPPVHAWAGLRVYKIEEKMSGRADTLFLERLFQKLLMNFTWWVNRVDTAGNNIFEGGFLGLDNIGVFDRSRDVPTGGVLEQSDGTSWMAMYSLNLLAIAIDLAKEKPAYEDIASKFFEHFLRIAHAMNHRGGNGTSLWDEEDGFFYDVLHLPDGSTVTLRVRSLVGLIPLLAVHTLEPSDMEELPAFARRVEWFLENRPHLSRHVTQGGRCGECDRRILAVVDPGQLRRVLARMLDPAEFLSPFGIRSMSKIHRERPFELRVSGETYRADYEPGESTVGLFGGNSNWRGPVWMPINFLLIESLQRFHHYLGCDFRVECPTGSGRMITLWEVAQEIAGRLIGLFRKGRGAALRGPLWDDLLLFYEYFNAETGAGAGASHQTGWTGLVAKLIQQQAEYEGRLPGRRQ